MSLQDRSEKSRRYIRLVLLIVALLPFVSIPWLGTHLYFRHDDSAVLLWAKEFSQPLYHALSTDPALNQFDNYPGMGPYWRPFTYLYSKVLWHLFGADASMHFLVGGVLFMVAVSFLVRLTEKRWGLATATAAGLLFMLAFHGTMYNLYHLTVAVSFFYQLGLIYFFCAYLREQRWTYLFGMLIFLVPAMGRQTTPMLLLAILFAELLQHRSQVLNFLRKNLLAFALLLPAFLIISFSSQTSEGSVLAIASDGGAVLAFLRERFFYYGGILTSGVTGVILLLLFSAGLLQRLGGNFSPANQRFRAGLILVTSLAITFLLQPPLAIYWLAICLIVLFIVDDELRLPLAWAGASLMCFLAAKYYHNGYLLEAGFPLAIAAAVILVRLLRPFIAALKPWLVAPSRRLMLPLGGVMVSGLMAAFALADRVPVLSERAEIVRLAISSSRNFKDLLTHLQHALPEGAIVYELSEKELGTTLFDRPHLTLKERAFRTKVMNIEDKLNMLKVLNRADLRIVAASQLDGALPPEGAYFIVLNNFEREIASKRFALRLVREFGDRYDSAAIYRFEAATRVPESPAAPTSPNRGSKESTSRS